MKLPPLPAPLRVLSYLAVRIFMGAVFVYAGYSKLMEPVENFRGIIAQYQVIPYVLVPAIAAVMPWMEFVFGLFLIVGYAPRLSALMIAMMSMGFLIILGSSELLLDSKPMSCGCFGEGGIHLSVHQVFILDMFDTAFGFLLWRRQDHPFSIDSLFKRKL